MNRAPSPTSTGAWKAGLAAAALAWALPALMPTAALAQNGTAQNGTAQNGTAQNEPAQPFTGQTTVTEVLLDVLVTDERGNVVVGLEPDDFVIEENGEPVEITDAAFYSNRKLLDPGLDANVDRQTQRRYFILFFQEQQRNNSLPGGILLKRQLEAARDAKQWLRKQTLLDDWIAVVSYDVRLKVHSDFTNDKAALAKAIESAVTGKDQGMQWPSRAPATGDISLLYYLPKGDALRDSSETIYHALATVARAAGETLGRKNLILFATGFGELTADGLYKPDVRYFEPMVRTLNDNNVAAYTIEMAPSNFDYQLASGLNQLAEETGGTYLYNFTRFTTPLRKITTENSGYYLISYRSNHPEGKSGFQRVSVAVRNPEFQVRARAGYAYGDPAALAMP
jgi:VWFA-related protein